MPVTFLTGAVDRNRSLDEFAAASDEGHESDTAEATDTGEPDDGDAPENATDTDDGDALGDPDATTDTVGSDDTVDTTDAGDDSRLPDPSTVEPLSPTYAAGREAACVECDASVAVRWRGSDGYVCADCKEW